MAHRFLPVLQDGSFPEATAKVSCSDCVRYESHPHGMVCHLFSRRHGDPRYVGDQGARQQFNFNANGDCFGYQAPPLLRVLRWLNALIRA